MRALNLLSMYTANTADLLCNFSDIQPEIEISVWKYQPSAIETKIIEMHILHKKNRLPRKTVHSFRSSTELAIHIFLKALW
jgi:hypothetical protein